MATMSREEARLYVGKLGRLKGYVSPENRVTLMETMPEVLESLESLREENAEDNRYTEAQANNQQPFLEFTIHPDRIIIDSNEDGFREVDVRAICSTGNSTKKGSQAYIGEKGIGFKSVFKVASKVHIESGAFSFYFKHSRRDDGLGIVTPIFEDHHGLPAGVRTRMTLTLTDPSEIGSLISEFRAMPDSSLMFLSKLQRITIAIVNGPEDVSETIYSYRYDGSRSRAAHIRYLYRNLPEDKRTLDPMIYLKDKDLDPVYRRFVTIGQEDLIVDDIYFETDEEYGVNKLVSKDKDGVASGAPKIAVHLLNEFYTSGVDQKIRQYGQSLEEWLEQFAQVRRVPRLVDTRDSKKLSSLFQFVLEHRKSKIIGTLNAHWAFYKDGIKAEIQKVLSQTTVPCEDAAETPLQNTYLPSAKLKNLARELNVSQMLPFVSLPPELRDNSPEDWDFLKRFGVRYKPNLDFYLDILHQLVKKDHKPSTKLVKDLFNVYQSVGKQSKDDNKDRLRKFFADEIAIYIPARASSEALWVTPSQCVWEAPDYFEVPCSLAEVEGYRNKEELKHLFNGLLDIKNADWKVCISRIEANKNRKGTYGNIAKLYNYIVSQDLSVNEDLMVREKFEKMGLIYVPQQQAWYPPSSCLWTESTRISGRVAIAGQYAALKFFFLHVLEVEEPNVSMLVEELKRLATSNEDSSITTIRALIDDIDCLGPDEDDLEDLTSCNFLPVRGTDGLVRLKNTTDVFAVVDRVEYEAAFKGRVAILDYSIEEAHRIRGFLTAVDLAGRRMSLLVEEVSTTDTSIKANHLTRKIRDQAYALFRCAVHYGATTPEEKSIYNKIRDAEVYESEGIRKTITLSLKATVVSVDGARSNLHIESDDKQFRLYVPKKLLDQQRCYLKQLPDRLASQLAIKDVAAIRVFGNILNSSHELIEDLLGDYGIVQLPWTDPDPHTVLSDDSLEENAEWTDGSMSRLTSQRGDRPLSSTLGQAFDGAQSTSSPSLSIRSRTESSNDRDVYTPTRPNLDYLNTPRTSMSSTPTIGRTEVTRDERFSRDGYCALLDSVITAAQRAEFPVSEPVVSEVPSDLDGIPPIVLSEAVFGRRSDNQISHDVKIGAAGELYAFEVLLNNALPGFGHENWKSTVRKEVCVHEKYANMGPWIGAETADITYEDEGDYALTNLLINHGYSLGDYLEYGARLKYYLEVKTTLKGCETRFYMSKAQYQRMQRMALSPNRQSTEVYIILRVFNLGQENMGMRLYVDPANLERNGELIFEAESYTVKPAEIEEEL
ncbi:hypothetical protein P7C71_g2041, partial [Lecanoromycetidae sp. Uapishka_2]